MYYVLLDTNIWVFRTDLLQDPIGQALLHVLQRTEGKLAIPSVVRTEIEKHGTAQCQTAVKEMLAGARVLERFCNYGGYLNLPSESEIRDAIRSRLKKLAPHMEDVQWTMKDAERAPERLQNDSPPNGTKNQQYKDSLIWEGAISLLNAAPVHFVTEDKGYYELRQPENGLSQVLLEETKTLAHGLTIYYTLSDCLSALTIGNPELQLREMIVPLSAKITPMVREDCGALQISVGLLKDEIANSKHLMSTQPT